MSKPHGLPITTCSTASCGKRIFFAPTEKGKQIPLCEEPHEKGNIFLREGVAVYASKKNPAPVGEPLYQTHFVDCPAAQQYRSKGA